jgi:putative ABC transport system permease protein
MVTFREQEGMGDLLDMIHVASTLLIMVFVLAMSVVLWNAGLLGGLRRFSEFGVRLALGEDKGHIYRTLILEGLLVGFIGTVIGMSIGLAISYMIQAHGVDFGGLMKNSTMMIPSVVRTVVTPAAFYIGFIPGMLSVLAGNALAGLRIYRRKTASLFKELEV